LSGPGDEVSEVVKATLSGYNQARVEAVPSHLTPSAATDAYPDASQAGVVSDVLVERRRAVPGAVRSVLDDDARLRLRLQHRSQENVRRQLLRAVVRGTVLMTADLFAFAAMRTLLRAVRDSALLGEQVASGVGAVLPAGALSGWQFAAALLIGLAVTGNYGPGDRRRSAARLFLGSALAVALPLWVEIWARGLPVVFVEYALTTILVWAGLFAERFTIDRVVAIVRAPQNDALRAIMVGPSDQCRQAAAAPVFASGKNYQILGFVDTDRHAAPDALGSWSEFGRVIHERSVEAVVMAGVLEDSLLHQVVDTTLSAGCELVSIPRTASVAGVRPTFVWRDGEPLVAMTAPALMGQQLFVKRVTDVAVGLLGLLLASPVLALVAIAIKLDSEGPVFFSQERVGFGGRRFRILKFRTMELDAEKRLEEVRTHSLYDDPRLFKAVADPRVTRLGRILRKTSLDELPQLWNVVRGQMSLVGPRPPVPSEVALYEAHHYARFDVKPGITGPWQVNGRNLVTDFEEVVRLETSYIREWSLWKDIAILARTVPVVLKMSGAH